VVCKGDDDDDDFKQHFFLSVERILQGTYTDLKKQQILNFSIFTILRSITSTTIISFHLMLVTSPAAECFAAEM